MTRPMLPLLFLALASGLGCSRPNLEVLHTLSPISREAEQPSSPLTSMALEVMPVRLPETVQRPQLVMELRPGALKLMESHRWGNGLDKDMQHVLVENLSLLLASDRVVAYPHGERIKATHRLELNVDQMSGGLGGTLTLKATWMVTLPQGGQALLLRKITLQRPVQSQDAESLVAAHSLILGDLSREIAVGLRALPAGNQ